MRTRRIASASILFLFIATSALAQQPPHGGCQKLSDRKIFAKHPSKVVPRLLREAGKDIIKLRLSQSLEVETKRNDADLKTKGDCASQSRIFRKLQKIYPKQGLFGEEKCKDAPTSRAESEVRWILDPIDGTTNYVHGLPHFSISLAVAVGGSVCYGAVYAPTLEELFWAERGKGAFIQRKDRRSVQLRASLVDGFGSSLWVSGFKAGRPALINRNLPIFGEVAEKTHGVRRSGSAALDLAYVAAGAIDGYWELNMDWWDIAAGLLLVEEAGGKSFVVRQPGTPKNAFEIPTVVVMASTGQGNVHETMKKILIKKLDLPLR